MGPLRIAVLANCQARPLTQILAAMLPEAELMEPVIVHLARPTDEAAVTERLAGADIVLSQLVADNYPVPYVSSNALRERFPGRVTSFVNLYYRGHNPELVYRRELMGKASFPLGDYHLETVHDAYRAGLTQRTALDRLCDPDWNAARYAGVADGSLAELRERERLADVSVADEIAARAAHERLFFTFNHPSLQLLADYALAIVRHLGLVPRRRVAAGMQPEPLSAIVLPYNPSVPQARAGGPGGAGPRTYRTVRAVPGARPEIALLEEAEIVESFYRGYREAGVRPDGAA